MSGGKTPIFSYNTCAFDSMYFVVAAMYADFKSVRDQIDERREKCKFSQMVSIMFEEGKKPGWKMNALLRLRNDYLRDTFQNTSRLNVFDNGMVSIDCSGNINTMIQAALPREHFSYTRTKICDQCGDTLVSNRCFVDTTMDQHVPIQNLNNFLIDVLMAEKSSYCETPGCEGQRNIVETKFSNFIAIDLIVQTLIPSICLNDIPENLKILDQSFNLFAGIEYIGEDNQPDKIADSCDYDEADYNKAVGHYIAHARRSNNQWDTYDDMKIEAKRSNKNLKRKIQILFYILNSK